MKSSSVDNDIPNMKILNTEHTAAAVLWSSLFPFQEQSLADTMRKHPLAFPMNKIRRPVKNKYSSDSL